MLPLKPHLESLVRTKGGAASRQGFLRLEKNESALELPLEIIAEFRERVTGEHLMMYPELGGVARKIAAWLGCRTENLFLSSGSDPAIKALFEAFVSPGDGVLLPVPTYQMMAVYAQMFQARLVEAHYRPGLELTMEELLAAVTASRPKLVCLANPNSPTGTAFSRPDVLRLIETAARQDAVVLLDEAYHHFYPETVVDAIERYPNLAVTRTFSKAMGLAALRMGFVAAHEEMIRCLEKVRPMYEISGLAALFTEVVLDHMEAVERNVSAMREGKRLLERELGNLGLKAHPTHANFMLIEVGSRERSREIAERLRERKILIAGDMSHPAVRNCIRVGLGSPPQMRRFAKELKSVLGELA